MEILKYKVIRHEKTQKTIPCKPHVEITGIATLGEFPSEIDGMPISKIAPYAFDKGVLTDEKITLPNTITEIGTYAFNENRFRHINIPLGVKVINNGVFYGCVNLESIIIPRGVTHIGVAAFELCVSLKEVIIPNTVVEIKKYAFAGCTELKRIRIPGSVTAIGVDCFQSIDSKIMIVGHKDTYAENYANENKIQFEVNRIPHKTIVANKKCGRVFLDKEWQIYLCSGGDGVVHRALTCCNSCDPDTTGLHLDSDWRQVVLSDNEEGYLLC